MEIWNSKVFGRNSPNTLENLSITRFIAVNVGTSLGEIIAKPTYTAV
jgi:hypothetical protein